MRKRVAAVALAASCVTYGGEVQGRDAKPGEWLQYRGDRKLVGHCTLKGDITSPEIKWKHYLGARETLLSVRPGGKSFKLALPKKDVSAGKWNDILDKWGAGAVNYDMDENGNPTEPSYMMTAHGKIGKFLKDTPGLQYVESDTGFVDPKAPVYVKFNVRKDGKWEKIWQSEAIPLLFIGNPIVGDFDGDGSLEIAVTPWYDVWILDLATGKTEAKARFTPEGAESGRAYGWFGASDLDKDGKSEFVILGDYQNHMEVMGWRDGKFQIFWSRLLESNVLHKGTELRHTADPVHDVDGDGQQEVVVSIFNYTGDNKWHVEVIDGIKGTTKYDFPDRYCSGVCDIDNDGISELLLTETSGMLVQDPSTLSVISCTGGKTKITWKMDGASFQIQPYNKAPWNMHGNNASSQAAIVTGQITEGGNSVFFTRKAVSSQRDKVEIVAWQANKSGEIKALWKIAGPYLEAVAVNPDKGILIKAQVPEDKPEQLAVSNAICEAVCSHRTGMPVAPVCVGQLISGSSAVVSQGSCERVFAFTVGSQKQKTLWSTPGRGMQTGMVQTTGSTLFGGIILADLQGNGTLASIAATVGLRGQARLVAIDSSGKEIWHHDFDSIPGATPPWNIGGLVMWFAGHFTSKDHCDVLVTVRRGTAHTEESGVLDGRTGKIVWWNKESISLENAGGMRPCGGGWMAVYDHNGDGFDDALCEYSDVVLVMDGPTGKFLVGRSATLDIFKGKWSAWGLPVVADFMGDGKQQMLYWAARQTQALLDHEGTMIWEERPTTGTQGVIPGVCDVDGDGKLELVDPGHGVGTDSKSESLACFEAATGRMKWTLDVPVGTPQKGGNAATKTAASVDIDGDGLDECIFSNWDTLYAVGVNGEKNGGRIEWSLKFPGEIGQPSIADVDGSGKPQIVVTCSDGFVYGVADKGAKKKMQVE